MMELLVFMHLLAYPVSSAGNVPCFPLLNLAHVTHFLLIHL